MVPAPSSAKRRARAGAVRRARPHRLAATRNATATMAEGLIVVWLAEADAADVEIESHCAKAVKHANWSSDGANVRSSAVASAEAELAAAEDDVVVDELLAAVGAALVSERRARAARRIAWRRMDGHGHAASLTRSAQTKALRS